MSGHDLPQVLAYHLRRSDAASVRAASLQLSSVGADRAGERLWVVANTFQSQSHADARMVADAAMTSSSTQPAAASIALSSEAAQPGVDCTSSSDQGLGPSAQPGLSSFGRLLCCCVAVVHCAKHRYTQYLLLQRHIHVCVIANCYHTGALFGLGHHRNARALAAVAQHGCYQCCGTTCCVLLCPFCVQQLMETYWRPPPCAVQLRGSSLLKCWWTAAGHVTSKCGKRSSGVHLYPKGGSRPSAGGCVYVSI